MSHLLARRKSTPSLRRKQSDSGSLAASSTTPSDQKPREERSVPYQDPRYKTLLETKGVFMKYISETDILRIPTPPPLLEPVIAPHVVMNVRGRKRKDHSTRRDLSQWELEDIRIQQSQRPGQVGGAFPVARSTPQIMTSATSATAIAIATTSAAFTAIINTWGDEDINEELLNKLNHKEGGAASSPTIAQGVPATQNASGDAANAPTSRAAQSSASGTQNITQNSATLSSAQVAGTAMRRGRPTGSKDKQPRKPRARGTQKTSTKYVKRYISKCISLTVLNSMFMMVNSV